MDIRKFIKTIFATLFCALGANAMAPNAQTQSMWSTLGWNAAKVAAGVLALYVAPKVVNACVGAAEKNILGINQAQYDAWLADPKKCTSQKQQETAQQNAQLLATQATRCPVYIYHSTDEQGNKTPITIVNVAALQKIASGEAKNLTAITETKEALLRQEAQKLIDRVVAEKGKVASNWVALKPTLETAASYVPTAIQWLPLVALVTPAALTPAWLAPAAKVCKTLSTASMVASMAVAGKNIYQGCSTADDWKAALTGLAIGSAAAGLTPKVISATGSVLAKTPYAGAFLSTVANIAAAVTPELLAPLVVTPCLKAQAFKVLTQTAKTDALFDEGAGIGAKSLQVGQTLITEEIVEPVYCQAKQPANKV